MNSSQTMGEKLNGEPCVATPVGTRSLRSDFTDFVHLRQPLRFPGFASTFVHETASGSLIEHSTEKESFPR